jgi:hypothetical protein
VALVDGAADAHGARAVLDLVDGDLGEVVLVLSSWGRRGELRAGAVVVAPGLDFVGEELGVGDDLLDVDLGGGLIPLEPGDDCRGRGVAQGVKHDVC